MKNINKGSLFPIVSVFIVVLILAASVYWFGKYSKKLNSAGGVSDFREVETPKEKTEQPKIEIKEEGNSDNVVEEETKDVLEEENGLEEKSVDESDESVIETLVLLLAQKHKKKIEDIKVIISKREGNYIVGGVSFSDEVSGGMLFAAKTNGAWKIVYDGNGVCSCSALSIVDFPKTLVKECLDDNTSEVVAR